MTEQVADEQEYQWGVYFEGRNLGWIGYASREEAELEVEGVEDKYAPAYLVRRVLGPIERIAVVDGTDLVVLEPPVPAAFIDALYAGEAEIAERMRTFFQSEDDRARLR